MFMIGHFVEYCPQHACPVPRITTRSYTSRLAELNYFSRLKYVHVHCPRGSVCVRRGDTPYYGRGKPCVRSHFHSTCFCKSKGRVKRKWELMRVERYFSSELKISAWFLLFLWGWYYRHNEDIMHSFQNFIVRLIPNHPPPLETRIWKLVVKALLKMSSVTIRDYLITWPHPLSDLSGHNTVKWLSCKLLTGTVIALFGMQRYSNFTQNSC